MSMKSGQMRTRVSEESAEFNWGPLVLSWEFEFFALCNFVAMINDIIDNGIFDPWLLCSVAGIVVSLGMAVHMLRTYSKG